MNNARKYIWTVYIILWVYFIFFDSSYDKGDHIVAYLLFGWLPFLILHFVWKNKNVKAYTSVKAENIEEIVELKKARKLREDKIISYEEFEKIKQKLEKS
jgi:hypothetical protein